MSDKIRLVQIVIYFLCSSCGVVNNPSFEKAEVNLKIYNFQLTGSTTISNLGLLNGTDSKSESYPVEVESNGGSYITAIKDQNNQGVSGFIVLVIQNTGTFIIYFENLKSYQSINFTGNSIISGGSVRVNIKNTTWYIRTMVVKKKYHIVIIITNNIDQ